MSTVTFYKNKNMLIKRIDKTKAEVKMYGSIGGWFVDGFNFTSILDELEADGVKEVTFRVHCYGGSVFEGDVIGGAFARSAMKINLIIDGIAASMMAMILVYVPVENIQIAENGFGMIHRPSGGSNGDAADHLSYAKLLLDIEGNFIRTLTQRTGKTAEEIKAFFDGKDHWLTADEMVAFKLVGSKIKTTASIATLDKLRIENMTEEGVYGHFAASLDPGSKLLNINNKSDLQMKKELIDAFQLIGVTAESSDTAVLAALQAKFKANEDRLNALEAEAKTKTAASIKALLDGAQTAGKITAESRSTFEGIGQTSGVAALTIVLGGMGAKTPINSRLSTESKGGASDPTKTFAWYQEHDAKALEAMPVTDPEAFKELYKAEYGCYPA
jgi:ATP-dependent protease ClpP protease subunit